MRLPNFLIIGAHRAGTSSLYRYLKQHPEVFMPARKEVRYFSYDPQQAQPKNRDGLNWNERTSRITSWNDYLSLFKGATFERAIGEASPDYLTSNNCARRIHATLPHARLIVSLRNPAERAYSLYLMACRHNDNQPKFSELLTPTSRYIEATSYYEYLSSYYHHFNRTQIKVVLMETLQSKPHAVVQELYQFLDVNPEFVPNVSVQYSKGGIPKSRALHTFLNGQVVWTLRPYVPESLKNFVRKIRNWNLKAPPPLSHQTRMTALQLYNEDIDKVENLTGVDLKVWRDV